MVIGRVERCSAAGRSRPLRRYRGLWSLGARVIEAALMVVLGVSLDPSVGTAVAASGANIHQPGVDCAICHTGDVAMLSSHRDSAATALVPNLEAVCNSCHSDEGVSHRTGMHPKRPDPISLPLAPDGTVTCSTCHFVHGEATTAESFERIDNRHGQLCLTCHELSELE